MMPAVVPGLAPLPRILVSEGVFNLGSRLFPNAQPVTQVSVSAFGVSETRVTWKAYQEYLNALKLDRVTLAVTDSVTGETAVVGRGRSAPDVIYAYGRSALADKKLKASPIELGGFTVFEVADPQAPPEGRESADQPAVNLSWWEMLAFAAAHGGDLPTEAEYERVMRGKSGKDEFGTASGELKTRDGKKLANFDSDRTTPVRTYPANSWGVYDASGNVWVWTKSWYEPDYTKLRDLRNPRGPRHGTTRVLRGGCAVGVDNLLRSACRIEFDPQARDATIGGVVVWRSKTP